MTAHTKKGFWGISQNQNFILRVSLSVCPKKKLWAKVFFLYYFF